MKNDNGNLKILLLLGALLIASNIFFAAQYFSARRELRQTQALLGEQRVNERTLAFAQLFIENVLKAETEVDFETRLQLENSVRAIGDEEILAQWKRFTESQSEQEAQAEVRKLLSLLMVKIEN